MAEVHAQQGLALGFFVGANVILVFLTDRIRRARTEAVTRASELTTRVEEREQSETAVRRADRLLSARSRDIMLFFCTDGKIVEVNPAAEAASGYSRAELLAASLQDLRSEETCH